MPITNVKAPSGAIIPVQHPEGATEAEIIGYAQANFSTNIKAQDGAEKYRRTAAESSFGDNLAAGFGGALPEAMRLGVKGIFNANKPGEVQDWKDSMSGLTSTVGGKFGAFFGAAAPAGIAAMTPPGQTALGAFGFGGINGLLQPADTNSERMKNMLVEGGMNAAIPAAIGTYKTGRALVDPWTQKGNERIAGRVLQRFATEPNKIAGLSSAPTLSGTRPTLAESSGDLGIANLQNILQSRDPRSRIAGRYADNNAARVGALNAIGGTDAELAKANGRRSVIGSSAYARAEASGIDAGMAQSLKPQIDSLLGRKEVKSAVQDAKDLAASEGYAIDNFGSIKGLQYLKQSLDDQIGKLGEFQANKKRVWSQTSDDLDKVLREIAPDLKRADKIYARLSREPNRMEVGRQLKDASTSALRDFGGDTALQAQSYARNLNRNSPRIVNSALGRRTEASIGDIMSTNQLNVLEDILNGVERQAAAQKNRTNGSTTARNFIGDDIVSQIAGPIGIPKSWAQSALAENFLSRPTSWFMKSSEERLNETLMRTMLDPSYASSVVNAAKPSALALKTAKALENTAPVYQGLLGGYQR